MNRSFLCLTLILMLNGCLFGPQPTNTPATKAAGEKMRTIREACKERRLNGEFKTFAQSERCADPDIIGAYEEAKYPYMDLIRFALAARLAGAEKVDRGQIAEAEYDRQLFDLRDRVADEMRRRNAEAAPSGSPATAPSSPTRQELDAATKAKLLQGLSAFSALES